jgi:hypothetical protein
MMNAGTTGAVSLLPGGMTEQNSVMKNLSARI